MENEKNESNQCLETVKDFVNNIEKVKIRMGFTEKNPLAELKSIVVGVNSTSEGIVKMHNFREALTETKSIESDARGDENAMFSKEIISKYVDVPENTEQKEKENYELDM